MKKLIYILRYLIVGLCLLFLWNGIKITYQGENILFINGVLFRYAFLCDIFYYYDILLEKLLKNLLKNKSKGTIIQKTTD